MQGRRPIEKHFVSQTTFWADIDTVVLVFFILSLLRLEINALIFSKNRSLLIDGTEV